jgi:hypothetical protein
VHPNLMYDLARYHQSELHAEARRERLVRQATRPTREEGGARGSFLGGGWSLRRLLRGLSFLGGPFQTPGGRAVGSAS